MKHECTQIVGKKITGIVIKEGDRRPSTQMFLLFSDNLYYEFYVSESYVTNILKLDPGSMSDSIITAIHNGEHVLTGFENGDRRHFPPVYTCFAIMSLNQPTEARQQNINFDLLRAALGKTIQSIVYHRSFNRYGELFILLNDSRYFIIRSEDEGIHGCGGLDKGGFDDVKNYLSTKIIYSAIFDA